jgi:ElaB/YqjD/DUF883 family membrane-anchored ribosome-binding protein
VSAQELTMTTQNGITDKIDALSASLRSAIEHLASFKDQAGAAGHRAAGEASSLVARLGRTIKDHPIAAVGIAFGIGYVAMRVLRR